MNVKINKDPRSAIDRKWDEMFERLCREAGLSPKQRVLTRAYVRELLSLKMHEIEGAVEMAYIASLIESEGFGVNAKRGAKRLRRVQERATALIDEAYGKTCYDASGRHLSYDGCGYERLVLRLDRLGVTYEGRI